MIRYEKTIWENDKTPVNAQHLGKVEDGLEYLFDVIKDVPAGEDSRIANEKQRQTNETTRQNNEIKRNDTLNAKVEEVDNAIAASNNNIKEVNNKFETIVASKQQDAEVILARGKYPSLPTRLDNLDKALYYDTETQSCKKPILREWDSIEEHSNGKYYYHKRSLDCIIDHNLNWQIATKEAHPLAYVEGYTTCFVNIEGYLKELGDNTIISKNYHIISKQDAKEGIICEDAYFGYSTIAYRILSERGSDLFNFKDYIRRFPDEIVCKMEVEKIYECTPIDLIAYENETNYMIECGSVIPKSRFKYEGNIGNVINTLKEKVSYLEDKLYKTNLANFTVALNALDTKLKLEQLTKTPK